MSTKFGIYIPQTNETVEVAFRWSIGEPGLVGIKILNPLVMILPPNWPVVAMDNTAQGIETVEQLLHAYHEYERWYEEQEDC